MRITMSRVNERIAMLNAATETFGAYPTVGQYVLHSAYGNYGLNQVMNEHGGQRTIFGPGETLRAVDTFVAGMLRGIDAVRDTDAV